MFEAIRFLPRHAKAKWHAAKAMAVLRSSALMDPIWYKENYPDLRGTPVDAVLHYFETGAGEGRNPGPLFDTKFYLKQNPDVAASGMNPLVHFIMHGAKEGRDPHLQFDLKYYFALTSARRRDETNSVRSSEAAMPKLQTRLAENDDEDVNSPKQIDLVVLARGATDDLRRADVDLIRQSDLFDESFYLAQNPDVESAGIDAALHYVIYGAKEGREPSPFFSAANYLKQNADIRENGINPLVHWLRHGRSEKRQFPFIDKRDTRQLAHYCNIHYLEEQYTKYFDEEFFISVITPTYNTDPKYLSELLLSLQNQRYSNWEWIVVDDGSTIPDTISQLKLMARNERRLRVVFKENNGISVASNAALSLASGTHFALVDHDDLLARDAFFFIWNKWKDNPSTELFYTDECKLSVDYELYDFSHKPAWSPVFLENTMYICHLSVYQRGTIEAVGGFRSAFDGTQDFDLALRISAKAKNVCHIPKICYFWRAIEGSTAATLDAKSYALERQIAAVREHARTKNPSAEVLPGWSPGFWYVDYPLNRVPPLVSYIIPTAAKSRVIRGAQTDLLEQCIRSLETLEFYPRREFVVVHNGDLNKRQLDFLATIEGVALIEYHPTSHFNFSEKLNWGIRHAQGEYLCILNDDVEVITRCGGTRMVGFLESNPQVGAIAPLCLFEDGRVQHNGVVLTSYGPTHSGIFKEAHFSGNNGYLRCRREAFGVTGALMFVKRSNYEFVMGFDESLPLNYNDVDFSLKLRANGLSCVVDPYISVYHFESSSKSGTFSCERQRLYARWPGLTDPYFNENFDQDNPFYELNFTEGKRSYRIDNDPMQFEAWLTAEICRRAKLYPTVEKYRLTIGVSIYDQAPSLLDEMLAAFTMQSYLNKEMVVIDNGSSDPKTIQWVGQLEKSGLAKVIRHAVNQGINGANRSIVSAMTGDFLLPVDADDYWTVDALTVMASFIESHPTARIFYSDEFNSDPDSKQFNPFFKPNFDPVLLTNCCYPTHLMAIQRELLNEIDAYSDNRATWCHDYDTLTRAFARGIKPVHVPELLYAWRIHPGSTAAAGHEAKPQTIDSQRFVLERLLKDLGKENLQIEANPLFSHPGMWRVKHRQTIPIPLTEVLDGRNFLLDSDRKALVDLAALARSTEGPEWIAILGDLANRSIVLPELFAVALLDADIIAVSGLICDEKETVVRWSGGFFTSDNTILDPYIGSKLAHSGYHGQLYCQRCVDVPAPMDILLRKDFLNQTLSKFGISNYRSLMIALGIEAAAHGKYIAVTPHVRHLVPARNAFPFPDDREGLLDKAGVPGAASRWYSPNLPRLTSDAYTIQDMHQA
ncbi:glycosyltransferase [Methyloferula stellata]|uniref:glycosyltransferase n=1 Tax=Methyloferula stellata TaxID=876270 RepID=UPI0003A3944C|nr:glycosyltransferase [Methyloferula stellata]